MSPFLTYGNLTLLNVEGMKAAYDEVLVEDCYRREQIPQGAIVLDVGGFGGEFGIWCDKNRDACVRIYEPSPIGIVAEANCRISESEAWVVSAAIGNSNCDRFIEFSTAHPTGSHFADVVDGECVSPLKKVICLTLPEQIRDMRNRYGAGLPVVVKLDCEGAEREIFDDESWLPEVHMVLLEFHFKDGERYREILRRHGFTVETNESNPEAWRGLIWATKK
jgi:FkbM family methyltransferase